MKVTINLEPFWTEDLTNANVADAIGIHPNSVSNLRSGSVDRCKLETIMKLREFFSKKIGKPVSFDDLINVEE